MKILTSPQAKNALSKILPIEEQAHAIVFKHYCDVCPKRMEGTTEKEVMNEAKKRALFELRGLRMWKLINIVERL
jgi:hypothetical protein